MSAPGDNLLVLRLSALGDVIHTMPAVLAIRRAAPHLRLAWVAESPYCALIEKVAPMVRVIRISTRRWRDHPFSASTRGDLVALRRALRESGGGGTAIDFQGLMKSAILGRIAGASRRIGFDAAAIREKPALLFYNRRVAVDRSRHVVEWNMELAHAVTRHDDRVEQPDYRSFAEDPDGTLARLMSRPTIVFNPGAGQLRKQWPAGRFAELAGVLRQRGLQVVLAWGPGEEALAREIAAAGDALAAPPTTLAQLTSLLARARAVVAGDTGPLHLAAAMGIPVVGLYGPTDPRRNGPHGQLFRCVETWSGSRVMDDITVRSVLERLDGLAENAAKET